MTLFDENGHLAQQALQAMHAGTLDEAGRLAISEHLCSCEVCFERYTQSLTDESLLSPPEPLAPGVIRALETRNMPNKQTLLGVACCALVGLWLLVVSFVLPPPAAPQQITPGGAAVTEVLQV